METYLKLPDEKDVRDLPEHDEFKVCREALRISPTIELGSEAVGTEIPLDSKG
mgnify:CR=1 FL=1